MNTSDLLIRPMLREELDLALSWAAAEGWNPGLDDAVPFYEADQQGFLIGLLDDQPVAMISAVTYGTSFAFMGFYIVRPEYRGRGYGWQIWQAAIDRLANRNIGLDGVPDQQDNYRKSGFILAHRNIRYQWSGHPLPPQAPLPGGASLIPLDGAALSSLKRYDRAFFADDRTHFLRCWIVQPHCTAIAVQQGEELLGYGVIRRCRDGAKIGPLFADTPEIAASLFSALCSHSDEPVFLDVPECNAAAMALAERHGMHRVFETARMYTQQAPEISLERTYGITSFELG
nr:GNAT family N-acetyltransferase [Mariprofundus ferrooxydans]